MYTHTHTHTHTHTDTHKHNTRDMILLSNADESFGDNSDLDLLWEILNHLDAIKAQRQTEEMPQTDNETSVPTDSHEIDQGVGNPMNRGSLDSNYSPTEEAIEEGNNSLKKVQQAMVALILAFHQQKTPLTQGTTMEKVQRTVAFHQQKTPLTQGTTMEKVQRTVAFHQQKTPLTQATTMEKVQRTVVALIPAFHQQKTPAFCRQDKLKKMPLM